MKKIDLFCEEIRKRLDAAECRSFSGKVEGVTALFDAIQLNTKDCVYVSALTPGYIVRAIIACGAIPVFCDISADGFVMDHKSLAEAVRQSVNDDKLYPRAVIAEHFCGLPFSIRAVRNICDRMGLFLIEDCGHGFGCRWEDRECGGFGDYAMISLGASSVFGTGGSGCLIVTNGANEFRSLIETCDGAGWDSADEMYGEALLTSCDRIPLLLDEAESALAGIGGIMKGSDFWLSRGGGRKKSACSGTVVIAQSEAQCEKAVGSFGAAGLEDLVRRLHVHRRSCFEHGCRGFKTLENASALAPRSFAVDIFGALHTGRLDSLNKHLRYVAEKIHD